VTENCRLIIAFFPQRSGALSADSVERLLAGHPVRIDRTEVTEKGILVFAQSTQCQSIDLTSLREDLFREGQAAGFRVRLQREDLFRAMHSLVISS
jgi:predicted amino acid-binding ACT domain protein